MAGGEKRGARLKDGSAEKRERELKMGSKSNGCSELISSPEGDKRGKEEKSLLWTRNKRNALSSLPSGGQPALFPQKLAKRITE